MRIVPGAFLILGLILAAPPAGAGAQVDGWYRPDRAEFAIDMRGRKDHYYSYGQEHESADAVVVDFVYAPGASIHGMFIKRSIQWIKLDKPMPEDAYDRAATDLVEGYLAGRLPNGHFVVADRTKARTASGRLIYYFAAKGEANSVPAGWQGTVQFFDTGIALVSEIVSHNTNGAEFKPKNGVIDPELCEWAATIRPGP